MAALTAQGKCVTIDDQPLSAESFDTVGHVLNHVAGRQRLVTNLLIDGHAPDLDNMAALRKTPLAGRIVALQTTEPRRIAIDVLDGVLQSLDDADAAKNDAADVLQTGDEPSRAMQKLAGCFGAWHAAQQSIGKVAELLRMDLDRINVDGRSLATILSDFGEHLKTIRASIEGRDFVTLCDVLLYELDETITQWRSAVQQMRGVVAN